MRNYDPCKRMCYQSGFTLIELMVSVLIGLFTTLAVAIVVIKFEGLRRTAVSGSDAQVSGAMAMDVMQRHVMSAAYGFNQVPGIVGCELSAYFNGAKVDFPKTLAPVLVKSVASKPDSFRVFYSGKESFAVPVRLKDDYSNDDDVRRLRFRVTSSLGVVPHVPGGAPGDLLLAGAVAARPCQVFRATAVISAEEIARADESNGWNASGFPNHGYSKDEYLVNLGSPRDLEFSVSDDKSLVVRELKIGSNGAPSYDGPNVLAANVVDMRVFYGKDTTLPDADGAIDEWSSTLPTTNDAWQRILAVRLAIVTRSAQFEREDVTAEPPYWDVGVSPPTSAPDVSICDGRPCVPFRVDDLPDWKKYRYKVMETVIPLRNMVWRVAS